MTDSGTAAKEAAHRAYAPAPGVVGREMGGAAVLIHLGSNRIFELNPTGARIWSLVCEGHDRGAIAQRLRAEFRGVPIDDLDTTIDALLVTLEREGLIRGR